MNDYMSVVEAIDRLTEAVSGNTGSFFSELVTAFLAMIGSVAAVLIFEAIKNKVLSPREEFRRLRRRVNSTLAMNACYYSNPFRLDDDMNCRDKEEYSSASTVVREMGVELIAFADDRKRKRCCGIKIDDIRSAGHSLIGLSNSFFASGDHSDIKYNKEREKDIRKLLGIVKKK